MQRFVGKAVSVRLFLAPIGHRRGR